MGENQSTGKLRGNPIFFLAKWEKTSLQLKFCGKLPRSILEFKIEPKGEVLESAAHVDLTYRLNINNIFRYKGRIII